MAAGSREEAHGQGCWLNQAEPPFAAGIPFTSLGDHVEEAIAARLLASINADRLVLLAGAGVSVSPPSRVPLATPLAAYCAAEHTRITTEVLSPPVANDLLQQTEFFRTRGQLISHFVAKLVPWPDFLRPPNRGHDAIADFLAAALADFVVTTNYDTLVESSAGELGEPDFRPALDGEQANDASPPHRPYLKIHGCCHLDRKNTIWCPSQLADPEIDKRLQSAKQWLAGKLPSRDVVVLGFWSDWKYLNSVLEGAVAATVPASVIVVDTAGLADLEGRAPGLWAWAHKPGVHFAHVQEPASQFLDELRARFSRVLLQQIFQASQPTYIQMSGGPFQGAVALPANLSTDDLYSLRRAFSGSPATDVTRVKRPDVQMHIAGATHLLLMSGGALLDGPVYVLNGTTIRLVNGAGQVISEVRSRFAGEGGTAVSVDYVICAGARDDGGVPPSVVRGQGPVSVVRAGNHGNWLTDEQARAKLGF